MTEKEKNQGIEQEIVQIYRDGEFYCNYPSGQVEQARKQREIVELNSQGLINAEIARLVNVSQPSVNYYLNKGGFKRNKPESERKSESAQKAAIKYHEKGWTDKKIAENIDCNHNNPLMFVKYHLDKHGLGQNVTPKQYKLFQDVVELNQQGLNNEDIIKYTGIGYKADCFYGSPWSILDHLGFESNEYSRVEKHEDNVEKFKKRLGQKINDIFSSYADMSPQGRKEDIKNSKTPYSNKKAEVERYLRGVSKAIERDEARKQETDYIMKLNNMEG